MRKRLCPVCGQKITLDGKTSDGRVIGSCGDAFWRTAAEMRAAMPTGPRALREACRIGETRKHAKTGK